MELSNPTPHNELGPHDLADMHQRELRTYFEMLSQAAFGQRRWMPLNAALQDLIDRKAPFEDLVDCARDYMERDNALIAAITKVDLATMSDRL